MPFEQFSKSSDPTFQTTKGLQRYREQIYRENKSRLFNGAKPSEAALKFLEERKKQLEEDAKAGGGGVGGARGMAGKSGVTSSTQRHVVDEGYDMVLKTEWGAATEGVNAQDPVFQSLNEGTIGESARTLHVQREESARRVHDTRDRLQGERAANIEWQERAHHIVEEGWARARESGLSASRNSTVRRSDVSRLQSEDHLYSKMAPEQSSRQYRQLEAMGEAAQHGGGEGVAAGASATHDFSSTGARMHRKKGLGLASAGVRAPTFTAERHKELTGRVRSVYGKPPPPPHDIFGALEKVTKTSMPRKELDAGQMEAEKADREDMQRRMEKLKRELEEERAATHRMSSKLASLKEMARADPSKRQQQ